MSTAKVQAIVQEFAAAAWRAQEAKLDGIELHSSHGYLINQFLSKGINRRKDQYGGSLENRYRFLEEIVRAVRQQVGDKFHFQAKISIREFNDIIPPWPCGHRGNDLEESIQICQWLERDGIDAIHVSRGSTFPHPLLPSGPFPMEMLKYTYDTMISSGGFASFRNYILFRYKILRPLFYLFWNRYPKQEQKRFPTPVQSNRVTPAELDRFFREHVPEAEMNDLLKRHQGTVIGDAKLVKEALTEIPVITTGGFQQASFINKAIQEGYTDAVSMARMLVANPDLVNAYFQQQIDIPDRPCTYCNECLGAYLELPVGCHNIDRFYQRSVEGLGRRGEAYAAAAQEALQAKNADVMSVFQPTARVFNPNQKEESEASSLNR